MKEPRRTTKSPPPLLLLLLFSFLIQTTQCFVYEWLTKETKLVVKVVHPVRANADGRFLSNDLSAPTPSDGTRRRSKRSIEPSEERLFVVIEDASSEILLQLTPNSRLLTSMTVIEWVYRGGERHVRNVENSNCFYSGRDAWSKGHSLVAVTNCGDDGLFGYIQTNNQSYFIEPLTRDLGLRLLKEENMTHQLVGREEVLTELERSDGMAELKGPEGIMKERTSRPHVIYKMDSFREKMTNLSLDQDFGGGSTPLFGLLKKRSERSLEPESKNVLKGGSPKTAPYEGTEERGASDAVGRRSETSSWRRKGERKRKRRKRNGCRKKSSDIECLTKREKRERKREKRRRERLLKKKMREKRKKDRKRKKKKKEEDGQMEGKSRVVDPLAHEDWEGYSPHHPFHAEAVAAGKIESEEIEVEFAFHKREPDPPKWLELTVGVDYTVIDFHDRENVEKYVFTLFNIVSAIYEDPSLNANLTIVLLRVIFYEDESQGQVLEGLAKQSLEAVNRWAETLYRLSAPHSRHDMAVWLTRLDLGGPSGYAPVSGVCDPSRSCTLNRDEGLTSAFIIAHEMGHVLGLSHDGDSTAKNSCEPEGRLGSVMAPLVAATFGRFHWSRCSRKEYHGGARSWDCLRGEPTRRDARVVSSSIQFQYSLDDQCRMEFGDGFGLCESVFGGEGGGGDPCTFLWCSNSSTPHLCKTKKGPPLEGTICAQGKWCRDGFCERIVSLDDGGGDGDDEDDERRNWEKRPPVRHNPQHGGWSSWGEWGSCSMTCGTGVRFRTRECNNPPRAWGGKDCEGKREDWKLCSSSKSCSEKKDSRAEQCALLPDLVRLGRRRSTLTWGPHEPRRRRKKCRLTCASLSTNEVYMGKETLVDGTPCSYDDPHSICVQGKCVMIGCDHVVGSRKKFDDCGVCGGNGQQCINSKFFSIIPVSQGYSEVAVIPKNAWNIRVEESTQTQSFLALKDNSSVLVLNADGKQEPSRDVISEGVMFHYVRKGERESLYARGPVLRPMTVMVHRGNSHNPSNISVAVSFMTKQQRQTFDMYRWRKGPLTPCSASCGRGRQRETILCEDSRTHALVNDDFCNPFPKPTLLSYPCSNLLGCEVRWIADPWESCSATCGFYGFQSRIVSCIKTQTALEKFEDIHEKRKRFGSSSRSSKDETRKILRLVHESLSLKKASNETLDQLTAFESLDKSLSTTKENPSREYEHKTEREEFLTYGLNYVDPLLCDQKLKPDEERPCNRIPCPSLWEPHGWTRCSVSCGMGQQEVIFVCHLSNEVENKGKKSSCGKRPREVRACFAGNCDHEGEERPSCVKDDSAFCAIPNLRRYCAIPKYYQLCCRTCSTLMDD